MEQGENLATSADPLAQRQDARREASDGESRQENTGDRWQDLVDPDGQVDGNAVNATTRLSRVAAATYLHSQE